MVETREHEDSHRNHGILRSEHGGPTFADETERLNYTITAYDVDQGTVFKQLSPLSLCAAIAVGMGADKWYLLSNVDPGDVVAAQTSASAAQNAIDTHSLLPNPHTGSVPVSRTLGFASPSFSGSGDLSTDLVIEPVFGVEAGEFCEGNDSRLKVLNKITEVVAITYSALPAHSGSGTNIRTMLSPGSLIVDGVQMSVGDCIYDNMSSGVDVGIWRCTRDGIGGGGVGNGIIVRDITTSAQNVGRKIFVVSGRDVGKTLTYAQKSTYTPGVERAGGFYWYDFPEPHHGSCVFYDFETVPALAANTHAIAGTNCHLAAGGAGAAIGNSPGSAAPMANGPTNGATVSGVIIGSTGTTSAGYYGIQDAWSATSNQPDGGGSFIPVMDTGFQMEWKVCVPSLSTASQEFANLIGLWKERISTVGQRIPTNGIGFAYDRLGPTTVNWRAVATSSGVTTGTSVNTSVTVAPNIWVILEMYSDIGSTDIVLAISGVPIATFNTNIPNELLGMLCICIKNTGITGVAGLAIDWYKRRYQTALPRA